MNGKIKSIIRIALLLLAFVLGISLVKSMTKIIGSGVKVSDAQNTVNELLRENIDLKNRLATVKSIQFVEQQARDKLGLAKKGEIVVVLPDTTILRALAPKEEVEKDSLPPSNWELWLKLFL